MDRLVDCQENIEKAFFARMRQSFEQGVDIVLFDTTTLVYYGEGAETEELLARGFSKAKRSDLKQVVIGVVMSKDGIPLAHEVFAGNKNDVTCFKEIIDKISKKFHVDKVVLVGDRGMISKKNIEHLRSHGYQYILGYRMRTIPKGDRAFVLSKADLKTLRKSNLQWKEPEISYLDAMTDLQSLDAVEIKIKENRVISRTEPKPGALAVISALKIKLPKRTLASEQKQAILV